ncbi:MAG: hypothetical protein ABIH25_05175 [Candidatus Woesearchaeota archaeon]
MVPKLVFKKNKKLDIINCYNAINGKSFGTYFKSFTEDFIKKIKDKPFEEVKEIIKEKIDFAYERDKERIEFVLKESEKGWMRINDEFFNRLEKIMKKKFLPKKITVYATVLGRCDYNYSLDDPFFKISIRSSPIPDTQIKTMMHEMMHFMFHWHYWDYCEKKIGKELTGHLKEALTFILNEEFNDIGGYEDKGYPMHRELRKKLTKIWRKDKDFETFLDKSINVMKRFKHKKRI